MDLILVENVIMFEMLKICYILTHSKIKWKIKVYSSGFSVCIMYISVKVLYCSLVLYSLIFVIDEVFISYGLVYKKIKSNEILLLNITFSRIDWNGSKSQIK